ncbi:hypothetical protein STEG23_028548, partial [Scotinomys teguina]
MLMQPWMCTAGTALSVFIGILVGSILDKVNWLMSHQNREDTDYGESEPAQEANGGLQRACFCQGAETYTVTVILTPPKPGSYC